MAGEKDMQQIGRFRFEEIEHTADKCVVAHGASFAEMLESAGAGMFAQQVDLTTVPREKKWAVSAEAESAEDLLIGWLRELLLLAERESVALCDFRILEFAEWKVKAEVWGGGYTEKVHRTGAGVKAVTYHNLAVEHDGEWRGRVTFDV